MAKSKLNVNVTLASGFVATQWKVGEAIRLLLDDNGIVDKVKVSVCGYKGTTEYDANNICHDPVIVLDAKVADDASSDYDGTLAWVETELAGQAASLLNGATT